MAGSNVTLYSTTAGNNATIGSITWAEGQAPSTVNDSARLVLADIRSFVNVLASGWLEYGDGDRSYTATYVAATQFKFAGVDLTSVYHVGRRIQLVATTPGTIYGTITASAFATDTTLTISWDSGSLSNEAITSVMVSPITVTNTNMSQPATFTLYSSDAGATEAPVLDIYRDSASPAASDVIGAINFKGEDSAGNTETYVKERAVIVDPTSTSENARYEVQTVEAGTLATRLSVGGAGGGVAVGTATDQGIGTMAVQTGYYIGTTRIPDTAATQAEQETGSSTTVTVTPGRQHFHASAAKFWIVVTVSGGTPTNAASYNVASITDSGAGITDITIATDFSGTSWASTGQVDIDTAADVALFCSLHAAGTVRATTRDGAGTLGDIARWSVGGFGDQ